MPPLPKICLPYSRYALSQKFNKYLSFASKVKPSLSCCRWRVPVHKMVSTASAERLL